MSHKQSGKRKILAGVVKSNKMDKTCIVIVERKVRHPMYGKVMSRLKNYYAHDEKNSSHVGDRVKIISTRPLSKLKRWRLLEIVRKAPA
jgi:small subunit ribosomal protein S17